MLFVFFYIYFPDRPVYNTVMEFRDGRLMNTTLDECSSCPFILIYQHLYNIVSKVFFSLSGAVVAATSRCIAAGSSLSYRDAIVVLFRLVKK